LQLTAVMKPQLDRNSHSQHLYQVRLRRLKNSLRHLAIQDKLYVEKTGTDVGRIGHNTQVRETGPLASVSEKPDANAFRLIGHETLTRFG